MVSFSHGRVFAWSAKPPQRSTTVSPSRVAQQDAPTSAPLAKFSSKASRTGLNLSATKPCTLFSGILFFSLYESEAKDGVSMRIVGCHPPIPCFDCTGYSKTEAKNNLVFNDLYLLS